MQYHAHALAASGAEVDLVGYEGTPLSRQITDDPRITVHRFKPFTLRFRHGSGVRYALIAVLESIRLSIRLWRALGRLTRPDLVLVQNPPAFPTLAVTRMRLARRGTR
jgi:beta-1,4-mannosyltransferase